MRNRREAEDARHLRASCVKFTYLYDVCRIIFCSSHGLTPVVQWPPLVTHRSPPGTSPGPPAPASSGIGSPLGQYMPRSDGGNGANGGGGREFSRRGGTRTPESKWQSPASCQRRRVHAGAMKTRRYTPIAGIDTTVDTTDSTAA